jgi:hypothetical protein
MPEDAAKVKGSIARSASFCLLVGAASRDAPDPVDVPKPSLGNGNWEQTIFSVQKYSIVYQGHHKHPAANIRRTRPVELYVHS